MKVQDQERFWPKVSKQGHAGCWLWTAGKTHKGHGLFWLDGTMQRAHRVSWVIAHGEIPDWEVSQGVCVLHDCGTLACVRPEHLLLGTNATSAAARRADGRVAQGESSGHSKLTDEAVRSIRRRYGEPGLTQDLLAAEYGVHRTTISWVVNQKIWKHIK